MAVAPQPPEGPESRSGSNASRSVAFAALGPVLLAAVLAGVWVQLAFAGRETRFEELGLGRETTPVFARSGDVPIHCVDLRDADSCLAGLRARGSQPSALWLGNSQLHAINQYQAGQETAPAILHRLLAGAGIDLLAFSPPNANLQEHYVLFEYLRSRLDLRLLVLPVVFDDLREDGLRATIASALSDPATQRALEASEAGAALLQRQELAPLVSDDLAGLSETVQERSEAALNGWLERNWPLWAARPEARGSLFRFLHHTRNRLFGITAQSTRRLIPARYERNLAALEAILESSRRSGIEVLVYVAPLRSDVATPYDAEEYAGFKRTLAELASRESVPLADLESLVPAEYWGSTSAASVGGGEDVDFMHFQAGGHQLLAGAVQQAVATDGERRR
jgi:hypothetical protein